MDIIEKNDTSEPVFWDERYLKDEAGWDIGSPTPIFQKWSKTLTNKKKILIPGAGNGHDAIFLSRKKHNVYALDFSKEAISNINSISNKHHIKLNIMHLDFFDLDNKYFNYFDIILEYTFFCAIPINRRKDYIKLAHRLLKQGGSLVGILLPIDKDIKDDGPPFGIDLSRTINDFSEYFEIVDVLKTPLSVESRMNKEVFIKFMKK